MVRDAARRARCAALAAALCFAPTSSLGADLTLDPSAREARVVVPVGSPVQVDVGVVDELLVVESRFASVVQVAPDSVVVDLRAPMGRAVIMLGVAGSYRTVVFVGEEPPPPETPARDEAESAFPAEIALGGDYFGAAGRGPVAASLYHWGLWSQAAPGTQIDAFVGLQALAPGGAGLADVYGSVQRATWGLELGDLDVVLVPSFTGFVGASAPLRGGSFEMRPGGRAGHVGVVGGIGRLSTCCDYTAPERLWFAAATGGWRPERGPWIEGLAGAMQRDVDAGVTPLVGLQGGYRGQDALVSVAAAQTGAGTAASASARLAATRQLRLFADGGVSTPAFRRPLAAREQLPGQAAAQLGAAYEPSAKVGFDAGAYARWRGSTDELPEASSFGGEGMLRWRPTLATSFGIGYRRFLDTFDEVPTSGDVVSAYFGVTPVRVLSVDGGVATTFISGGDTDVYANGRVELRPSDRWRVEAQWMGRFLESLGAEVLNTASLSGRYRSRSFEWGMRWALIARSKRGIGTQSASASSDFLWDVRRWLQLGGGAYVTAPLVGGNLEYGANFSWVFRPSALGRARGGLGLRGGIEGVVYIDHNLNGVYDDDDDVVPDMGVQLDDAREARTDAEGRYAFPGIAAGDHRVTLERQQFHSLGPTTRDVAVSPLDRETVNFGVIWGGRVLGLVYVDMHGDGAYDNGDPGVTAEIVSLRDSHGVVVGQSFAEGGRFSFTGLQEGEYTVMVDSFGLPEGYTPVDDLEPTVFVEEGKALTLHIRLHANRAIGGVVWEDVDKDGVGAGKKDLGIGGAEVYLSTGEVAHTGPDGSFLFRDLSPGAYAVRTELGTEAKVVVLPVEPKEVLDLSFVLPKGTRPPAQNVTVAPKPADSVAGLVLEAPMKVLPQGVELQVTATAVLSNGETREVTTRANWSSSDAGILTISPEGKVSGHGAGTAGVTAEWKGGVGDPLTFEVLGTPLDRITVSPVGLRLNPGNTADLRVDVLDRSGRGGEVTPVAVWQVADTRIARVDATGRLKALRDGVTTVQARIGDTWSSALEIQVITAEVTALSIENLPARMPEGATVQLKATGYDTRLEIQNVTESVTWASSDPDVVQVEADGRIIAVGRGTAQITASIGSLFTRSRTVFVTNTPPLAIEVVPPGMTLSVYDVQRFRATATFEDGTKGAVTTVVEWIVEGNAAFVRPDGTVIPREAGTVRVRARYLGVESAPVTVTITP